MDSPQVAASISPVSLQHRSIGDDDNTYDDDYFSVEDMHGSGAIKATSLRSLSNEELEAELEGVSGDLITCTLPII